jgi:hypothetical protein
VESNSGQLLVVVSEFGSTFAITGLSGFENALGLNRLINL